MKSPILIFDVMRTLVEEPFDAAIPTHFGLSPSQLRRQLDYSAWTAFEEGKLSESQYLKQMFLDRREVDQQALVGVLRRSYHWLDGVPKLLADLQKANHTLHLFSNYSSWFEVLIDVRLKLFDCLKPTFVSYKTGYRKPKTLAFQHVVDTLSVIGKDTVRPNDCLLVDDQLDNIVAASEFGFQTILRTPDTAALRKSLEERIRI